MKIWDLKDDVTCVVLKPLKAGGVGQATGVPDKAAVFKTSHNVGKIESFQSAFR